MADYKNISRNEWLSLAVEYYEHLFDVLDTYPEEGWKRFTPYLGWTSHDVLAHMTSAIRINFNLLLDKALNGNPVPETNFNFFLRNAEEVKKSRRVSSSKLVMEFRTEINAILEKYRLLTERDWLKPAWFYPGEVNVRTLFLVQLSDNIFHERDLLLILGKWKGLNPKYAESLVDWFMREFRPAGFRPEKAEELDAVVCYRLSGACNEAWTMTIFNGKCSVEKGANLKADVTVQSDTENLISAALARAKPYVGRLARVSSLVVPVKYKEDFEAAVTGSISLLSALTGRQIKISGDKRKIKKLNKAFWHFWQRTSQAEENIRKFSYLNNPKK